MSIFKLACAVSWFHLSLSFHRTMKIIPLLATLSTLVSAYPHAPGTASILVQFRSIVTEELMGYIVVQSRAYAYHWPWSFPVHMRRLL